VKRALKEAAGGQECFEPRLPALRDLLLEKELSGSEDDEE
jgi:hypothetical protein